MRRADVDKLHRSFASTKVNYITLSWTSSVVRFSEEHQIVDCLDILNLIYGSESSATTAQNRWFSKGEGVLKTSRLMGIEPGDCVLKVKWTDTPRTRLALSVNHMYLFLTKVTKSVGKALDISKILDTEKLTVIGAQDRAQAVEDCEQTAVVVTTDDNGNEKFQLALTSSDVQKFVAPRTLQRFYEHKVSNEWVQLDWQHAEKAAEIQTKFRKHAYDEETNRRNQVYEDEANKSNVLLKKTLNAVKIKIQIAEEMGMTEECTSLKRKLQQLLQE